MAEEYLGIAAALSALEEEYVSQKERFKLWVETNAAQRGTDVYDKYVEEFNRWETSVQEQKRQLLEKRNNPYGNADVDQILDLLLARITLDDFMVAIATMTSKDPTFFSTLLSSYLSLKNAGEIRPSGSYQTFSSAVAYPTSIPHPYSTHQYASSTPTQQASVYTGYVGHPDIILGAGNAKRPFERAAAVSGTGDGWTIDEPARKSFRAPSPIKDYRNPSTLPFRDFSQT